MRRRQFLRIAGSQTLPLAATAAGGRGQAKIRAVAFDGFTTFDPRPVGSLAEEMFPGKGTELSSLWRTRQFEYTWLRTLTRSYADFWQVTQDALLYSARLLKLELTPQKRSRLMDAYLELRAWPDAAEALQRLKAAGIRMSLLSNFTEGMLNAAVKNSGLEGVFGPHLSTDRVRSYKPSPQAYQMGVDSFGLKRDEIAFAAFGGWDAAGAKRFGYPTFWVNRMSLPAEELGVAPDAIGPSLHELADFVLGRQTRSD